MPVQDNYLFLVWKDPETKRNFTIGKLTRNGKFTFEYCPEADDANKYGWSPLEAFPDHKIYESDIIFPVFSSRLPDCKRRDMDEILEKYGLSNYDEFELLRKSGARLPIDTYEFIDPIFPEKENIEREFLIVEITNSNVKPQEIPPISEGDLLKFKEELENEYDNFAIQVLNQDDVYVGYIPKFYNKGILERMKKGITYSCEVTEVQPSESRSERIKVKLNMPSIY